VFSLGQSAEVIIWTIVGGLGTLAGPIAGAIVLGYLKLLLGQQTLIDNSLVLGAILVLVVLLLPSGLLPALTRWRERRDVRPGQPSAGQQHAAAAQPAERTVKTPNDGKKLQTRAGPRPTRRAPHWPGDRRTVRTGGRQ
jgi:branched-chain amino acid transport system permease protein